MTAVLNGIRVLDFGRYLAGPFCGALLGDLGAEVIRIERIEGGEDRTLGPVTDDDMGAVFLQANRNKRGMTLNPSTGQGQEITRQLVASSDVVVANLPPRVLAALGLDYESLCQVKPDIILTTINAFGAGAWEDKLGFRRIGPGDGGKPASFRRRGGAHPSVHALCGIMQPRVCARCRQLPRSCIATAPAKGSWLKVRC